MLLFILIALILARIRGNRVAVLAHEISLVPLWLLEVIFWIFQICAWCGEYRFVAYAGYLQTAYILSLIWPILRHRLYLQAIAGACMVAVGSMMNRIVMNVNGGRMPVYPTLSRLTGYYQPEALEMSGDMRHVLMSEGTKLNFLGDFIDVGFSIMSIGDLLIHGFVALIIYCVIVDVNRRKEG